MAGSFSGGVINNKKPRREGSENHSSATVAICGKLRYELIAAGGGFVAAHGAGMVRHGRCAFANPNRLGGGVATGTKMARRNCDGLDGSAHGGVHAAGVLRGAFGA